MAEIKTMSSTEVLTVKESGDLTLPADIIERYQIEKEMQFRVIETQKGVLLIPLTDEPMSEDLAAEIEEWQEIGAEGWDMFEYVEPAQ
jgi:bifunctional DNA-binding transcriptional regulator/antitoxin component of YhaV-PrlF toxin-antitoxin module